LVGWLVGWLAVSLFNLFSVNDADVGVVPPFCFGMNERWWMMMLILLLCSGAGSRDVDVDVWFGRSMKSIVLPSFAHLLTLVQR